MTEPSFSQQVGTVVSEMQNSGITFSEGVRQFKREWLKQALENVRGNNCRAARAIGMHRNTLSRLAMTLNINVREIRQG